MLSGVDVSYYQGIIDWNVLKQNSNFAIIQSSYGNGYVDPQFYRNRDESRRVQIPHGFYQFAYPQYNQPQQEADWFLKTIGTPQDGEFLCLDFEQTYSDPVSWCKAFLDHVSISLNNYMPLLYIDADRMKTFNWTPVANAGYGLWLAEYNGSPETTSPLQYWSNIAFHQWESTEVVPGVVGPVDADYFFGDKITLDAYGYKNPQPIPTPTPSGPDYKSFSLQAKTIINGGGLSFTKISQLKQLIAKMGI